MFSTKRKRLSIALMILGLAIFFYPKFSSFLYEYRLGNVKNGFEKNIHSLKEEDIDRMIEKYREYEKGFDSRGGSIVDPFDINSYRTKNPIEIKDGIIAYITIPKLDIDHPVYMGSSQANLAKGMAQVEGTSLPVGGMDTRSVIAGHRGTYKSGPMFRHIDRLKKGDEVYITSLKGNLKYRVVNKEIILPSDNEKLLPVKGEDMLTLLTCHPYPLNKQRLLVNCVRVD